MKNYRGILKGMADGLREIRKTPTQKPKEHTHTKDWCYTYDKPIKICHQVAPEKEYLSSNDHTFDCPHCNPPQPSQECCPDCMWTEVGIDKSMPICNNSSCGCHQEATEEKKEVCLCSPYGKNALSVKEPAKHSSKKCETIPTPEPVSEVRKRFEANMLDGDDVNYCGGTMLSAPDVLEYLEEEVARTAEAAEKKGFKDGLGKFEEALAQAERESKRDIEAARKEARREERERIMKLLNSWKAQTDFGSEEVDKIYLALLQSDKQ